MTVRTAYTVSVRGVPQTNCVHGHARGAMANWLWLEGVRFRPDIPDEAIRVVFLARQRAQPEKQIQLTLVQVEALSEVDAASVQLEAPPPPAPPLRWPAPSAANAP